jgi:hypothetical protein
MTGHVDLFIDLLAFWAGLAVIIWVGLKSSRREGPIALPAGAAIGILVWLTGLGFAIYLIFG